VSALALAVISSGAAKSQPSTIYVDKAGGSATAIPKTWKLIPPTQAGVKALIATLEKKKLQIEAAQLARATLFASIAQHFKVL